MLPCARTIFCFFFFSFVNSKSRVAHAEMRDVTAGNKLKIYIVMYVCVRSYGKVYLVLFSHQQYSQIAENGIFATHVCVCLCALVCDRHNFNFCMRWYIHINLFFIKDVVLSDLERSIFFFLLSLILLDGLTVTLICLRRFCAAQMLRKQTSRVSSLLLFISITTFAGLIRTVWKYYYYIYTGIKYCNLWYNNISHV